MATGSELDWTNVPGSDPADGSVHTCFSVAQAMEAGGAIERFLALPGGRAIVGANPGASCIDPAYELIMMLETELRRRKRRHLFDLHLVTPEPFLGHFGVNGIGNLVRMMEDELVDGVELPFDLALLIPAFLGAEVVRSVEGLGRGVPLPPRLSRGVRLAATGDVSLRVRARPSMWDDEPLWR